MEAQTTYNNLIISNWQEGLGSGHFNASELPERLSKHRGEGYCLLFDLEPRPTFKEYVGRYRPALGIVVFDFDSKEDLGESAKKEALEFLNHFNFTEYRIFFSGRKGFHIHLPFKYFGPAFRGDLVKSLKSLSKKLKQKWPTIDDSIYTVNHLMRIPGSLHPVSGLYSWELAKVDAIEMTMEEIRDMADFDHEDIKHSELEFDVIEENTTLTISLLDSLKEAKKYPENIRDQSINLGSANLEILKGQCHYISRCHRDAKKLSQSDWFELAYILKGAKNAQEIFLELSKPHPDFDEAKTIALFERAQTYQPPSCEQIGKKFKDCPECPSFGEVMSPNQIVQNVAVEGMFQELIDLIETSPEDVLNQKNSKKLIYLRDNYQNLYLKLEKLLVKAGANKSIIKKALGKHKTTGKDANGQKYSVVGNTLVVNTQDGNRPLTNFNATIDKEVTHEDGISSRRQFVISGSLVDGSPLRSISVPTDKYQSMSWLTENYGASPIIHVGPRNIDHVSNANRALSIPTTETVYEHTGFNGTQYLHAIGAIGAGGAKDDLIVSLPDSRLNCYKFESPPPLAKMTLDAVLETLQVGPMHLILPLFLSTFRAVLGHFLPIDFSVFVVGPTGSLKTSVAAIFQSFFGRNFSDRNLPGSWSSTSNALERSTFAAKDAPFVIDDFVPNHSQKFCDELNIKAERVLRGSANQSGRARMSRDAKLSTSFYPRCLIISTGEDMPRMQSLRARSIILKFESNSIDKNILSSLQSQSQKGVFENLMFYFIQYVAKNIERFKTSLPDLKNSLRDSITSESHKRTPDAIANLQLGTLILSEFIRVSGFYSKEWADKFEDDCWKVLLEVGKDQAKFIVDADPANRFFNLLLSLIASRSVYLKPLSDNNYSEMEEDREIFRADDDPRSKHIGHYTENEIILFPEPTLECVKHLARGSGEEFSDSKRTLGDAFEKKGWTRSDADHNTAKVSIETTLRSRCWVFTNKKMFKSALKMNARFGDRHETK